MTKVQPIAITSLFLVFFHISGFSQDRKAADKKLEYTDKVYEGNIKTVMLYPGNSPAPSPNFPEALPMDQSVPLVLSFDEINSDQADYYMVRIVRCEADWRPSALSDMQYLHDYNEFTINQYDFSMATKMPYVHYTFAVPQVKLPGNYLLVVYRNYKKDDIIITKRFFVFDQEVTVQSNVGMSTGVAERLQNQQIDFQIDYPHFPIANPLLDVKVVVRQNDRWDNALRSLHPTMVREDLKQIVFRSFNFENNFKAGNEFRFFDMRSIHYSGQNIDKIVNNGNSYDAYLFIDKPRTGQAYSAQKDLDGGYLIENKETPNPTLESDYLKVHFFLRLPEKSTDAIYVGGKLTNWNFDQSNQMSYIEASGLYTCAMNLKEGIYDYNYFMPEAKDPNALEGNHFETRNHYDILVYYRDPTMQTDLIIGYVQLR